MRDGITPLDLLAEGSPPSSRRASLEVAKMLVDHGAWSVESALDIARKSNFVDMVNLLEEKEVSGVMDQRKSFTDEAEKRIPHKEESPRSK